MHSTSAYPCKTEELNLNVIKFLKEKYIDIPIGYSGHEVGLSTTLCAAALGATIIERHVTLDRSMWGSDQSASIEIHALKNLIRDIRVFEKAAGDGKKKAKLAAGGQDSSEISGFKIKEQPQVAKNKAKQKQHGSRH